MSLFVLDTDQLTLYQMGHPRVVQNVIQHIADALAICVITVEEQLTGWQRAMRLTRDDARREEMYRRMALTVESLAGWRVLPLSQAALGRHALLLRQRLNVGSNDLKIAACALEHGATVVTRNRQDFQRVPGLVCEDWAS